MFRFDVKFAAILVFSFGLGSALAFFSRNPEKFSEFLNPDLSSTIPLGNSSAESPDSLSSNENIKKNVSEPRSETQTRGSKVALPYKSANPGAAKRPGPENLGSKEISDAEEKALFQELGIESEATALDRSANLKSFKDYSEEPAAEHSGIASEMGASAFEKAIVK